MPRAGGGTPWAASQRAAASMLLVRYSTWNGPGPRRASASAAGPGSAGCAGARITDVDATLAHLRHVGHEVVALHGDIAQSPAARQKLQEAPTRMAGEVLVLIAYAQQFEIVLLVKRNGVVRTLAWMHTAGRDSEPEAPVGVNALLQIGDADHDVVDARQHSDSSCARDRRMRGI